MPLHTYLTADTRPLLYLLTGAVGFVLLIACANVGNLLLSRAVSREHEIGVRAALGAGRGRLLRQLLTESTLISVLGGAMGLLVAFWGVRALAPLIPGTIPTAGPVAIDREVLVFTLAISLLVGILVGLAPALRAARSAPLRDDRRPWVGTGISRSRAAVVVAEVALALMLLIGAGLLIRSFVNLQGALGIPLVAGRFFTEQDGGDIEALAIINTRVARRLWGDQDPVGRALSAFQDMRLRIVGVVANTRDSIEDDATPKIYLPYRQFLGELRAMMLAVQTTTSATNLVGNLGSNARSDDPTSSERRVNHDVLRPRGSIALVDKDEIRVPPSGLPHEPVATEGQVDVDSLGDGMGMLPALWKDLSSCLTTKLRLEGGDHPVSDVGLDCKRVVEHSIELSSPEEISIFRRRELHRDAHSIARQPQAAFEYGFHAQQLADPADVLGLILEANC